MIHNTILELQEQNRLAEAGYGRLFAYDSKRYNAMIDVRSKAKYIRKLNPDTWEDTQKNITYSGPTVFFNNKIRINDHKIDKMDVRSAYLAYLINQEIKKPGIFRIKHHGAVKVSDRIALYIVKFNCSTSNMFVKWFLNASGIHKKKFKSDGSRVCGEVGIFTSTQMDLLKYVRMFLKNGEGDILRSYTFHGKNTVNVKYSQIQKLYDMKQAGSLEAKAMLVQSTGWLSLVDRPTYYHMIQFIKFFLLDTVYRYKLQDDLVGIQTDCIFTRVTEENQYASEQITMDRLSLSGRKSSIGTYKIKRVNFDEIITNKARVVLK